MGRGRRSPVPRCGALVVLVTILAAAACERAGESAADSAYVAETDAWHARRLERLAAPDGWLTLIGRYELAPGTYRLGSAPACELRLAAAVPAMVAELVVGETSVQLIPGRGVDLLVAGQAAVPGEALPMVSDAAGEPTVATVGSVSFYVIARGDRRFLRVKDSASPVRREFAGIARFPVDERWRVIARLDGGEPRASVEIGNVLGQSEPQPTPGRLVFALAGRACHLVPIGEPGESLFIVFADSTNGVTTYGGGRFLSTDPPGPDGTVVLDFNRAVNPPCAFTPYATCPLPPPENVLPVAVTAGEKSWGEPH